MAIVSTAIVSIAIVSSDLLEHGVKADARHPLPLGQLPLEVEAYDHHLG